MAGSGAGDITFRASGVRECLGMTEYGYQQLQCRWRSAQKSLCTPQCLRAPRRLCTPQRPSTPRQPRETQRRCAPQCLCVPQRSCTPQLLRSPHQ
eukprot:3317713-Pyramimonas_sp.AAC.1